MDADVVFLGMQSFTALGCFFSLSIRQIKQTPFFFLSAVRFFSKALPKQVHKLKQNRKVRSREENSLSLYPTERDYGEWKE